MHDSRRWIARMMAALVISSLSAGSVSAGPPPAATPIRRPVVVRADVDQVEPDRLVIRGTNFGGKSKPVVVLANVALEVLSFSDDQIVARLPVDAPPARYALQVLVSGAVPSKFFEVTLGRNHS